jgi:hypothetical protein
MAAGGGIEGAANAASGSKQAAVNSRILCIAVAPTVDIKLCSMWVYPAKSTNMVTPPHRGGVTINHKSKPPDTSSRAARKRGGTTQTRTQPFRDGGNNLDRLAVWPFELPLLAGSGRSAFGRRRLNADMHRTFAPETARTPL